MNITIPKLVPRRPDRPQRLGQEHVRPQALQGHRDPLLRRLPGDGLGRRERPGGHQGRLRGAPVRRRQAARPGAADGHRRHQRPARGPQAAGRVGPAVPLPAGGGRPRHARAGLPGAEPGPARPGLRPARRPQPVLATAAVAPGAPQGGLPARLRDGDARGGRGGDRRAGAALERPDGRARARSTSSAMSTAAATSLEALLGRLGYEAVAVAPGGPSLAGGPAYAHPEGRKAVFLGDLVDRGPRILDTVRLVRNMVAPRLGPLRPRQPRHEARQGSSRARTSRSRTGWPTRWPRSTPCPARCGPRSARRSPTSSTGW